MMSRVLFVAFGLLCRCEAVPPPQSCADDLPIDASAQGGASARTAVRRGGAMIQTLSRAEATEKPAEMSALAEDREAQEPDPPAAEADVAAGTLPLTSRITALERRVVSLEGNSGKGRADLKNEIAALKMTVQTVKTGGAGSLEHTAERVGKAEKTMVSLEGALDKQNADLKGEIESLKTKLDSLEKKVGR